MAGDNEHQGIATEPVVVHTASSPAPTDRSSADFVGREPDLAALTRVFEELDGRVVVITGRAGVGKTRLAAHWARQHADLFPDGLLFVDVADGPPATSVRAVLSRVFADEELADRQMLVVLDSVGSAKDILDVQEVMRSATVLATSREALGQADWPHVALGPFTADDAYDLLKSRLGTRRLRATPAIRGLLVKVTEGLPGKLEAVARELAHRPTRSVDSLLSEWRRRQNSSSQTLSVAVYLSDETHAERVEQAVEEVLAQLGGEVLAKEPPVISSWFRRMRVRFRDAGGPEALRRAVELRAVEEVQAKVNAAQGDVIAKLLTALADTPTALIQIGSMLLIKIDGVPLVRNLTPVEQVHMQRNPDLARDPAACLAALQLAADQAHTAALTSSGQHAPGISQ